MSSPHITDLVLDYMENRLSPMNKEKVKSHLVFCNQCRSTLNDIEKYIQWLKDIPSPQPKFSKIYISEKKEDSPTLDKQKGEIPTPIPTKKQDPTSHPSSSWRGAKIMGSVLLGILLIVVINRIFSKKTVIDYTEEKINDLVEKPIVETIAEKEPEKPLPPPPPVVSAVFKPISLISTPFRTPFEKLFNSQSEWENFWTNELNAGQTDVDSPPLIDFEEKSIVVLAAGDCPSEGYSLEIKEIEKTSWEGKHARVVHYRLKSPPKNKAFPPITTQPLLITTVPKSDGFTYFRRRL